MAQVGGLVTAGETVSIELAPAPADYVEDSPAVRRLHVRVDSVDRHVPQRLTLNLEQQPPEESEESR